jgi:hypothetical protein
VIWRGDHNRRTATAGKGRQKILVHPDGEFLLVLVEQNDMLAAPGIEDFGPGCHRVSPNGVESQLS